MSSRACLHPGASRVGEELAVHRVREPALEAADGLLLGLALLDLAQVVGPPRCVEADLADGGDVQGVVELAVAPGVQAVALLRS